MHNQFSHIVSVFHNRQTPEPEVKLAGYAAMIKHYQLQVPLPDQFAAISHKHARYEKNNWLMFTPRHNPKASLQGHLTFALKYEGINLLVLKALFKTVKPKDIIKIIKHEPTGSYSRRIWFLYEWLQQKQLNIPNAITGNFVDVLDSKLQFAGPTRISKRQLVRNNLPGIPEFCPIIRKTKYLVNIIEENLSERAKKDIGSIHPDILKRAAAFMLLKDSKASFAIEGETPTQSRSERWARVIAQAGMNSLSHQEFLRLQQILIEDFRFTHFGYRNAGGFVGEHERSTGLPIPEHISAKWQDIGDLMGALITVENLLQKSDFDSVLLATSIAFGFVFIHPLEDGNGRIHRFLIHHELAQKKFTEDGFFFPISAAMLEQIAQYREVLQAFSKPRLELIKWRPTLKGNVEVANETIDLYRYFDATKQAEFLYACIKETIERTLPEEIDYLKKHDEFKQFLTNFVEMPDRLVNLMIRFLNQNKGKFSKRTKSKEFSVLTDKEILVIEKKYAEIWIKG
jgi:Fic family protein